MKRDPWWRHWDAELERYQRDGTVEPREMLCRYGHKERWLDYPGLLKCRVCHPPGALRLPRF